MQQSISGILSLTDMFENFTKTQLELVAALCEPNSYAEGDIVFEENASSDDLYIIRSGRVEILVDPARVGYEQGQVEMSVIAELRQGQILGEVALVDQGLRSATVRVSAENTQLLRISRQRLMLLCDTYPELGYKLMKNLAADLALKIRNSDLTISQYRLMLVNK
jgi:CRP/FNR family transcriptional regulator, cyclic AMP receptor protein